METTSIFSINLVGEESGNPYTGTFKIKTLLTRRDSFAADEKRRLLLGANPENAMPNVALDAFMLAQLAVRVLESPKWWTDSNNGIDLDDPNVINEVFTLTMKAEMDRKEAIKKKASELVK